jgi:hypothetical protein
VCGCLFFVGLSGFDIVCWLELDGVGLKRSLFCDLEGMEMDTFFLYLGRIIGSNGKHVQAPKQDRRSRMFTSMLSRESPGEIVGESGMTDAERKNLVLGGGPRLLLEKEDGEDISRLVREVIKKALDTLLDRGELIQGL